MNFPQDLKYTKEHEWVKIEGSTAVVGITDFAQSQLGDVVFVEVPEAGKKVKSKATFSVVESVKAVSDIYAPLSGTIIKANEALADTPELINQDPYGDGWIAVFELADTDELSDLLDADAYRAFVEEGA